MAQEEQQNEQMKAELMAEEDWERRQAQAQELGDTIRQQRQLQQQLNNTASANANYIANRAFADKKFDKRTQTSVPDVSRQALLLVTTEEDDDGDEANGF